MYMIAGLFSYRPYYVCIVLVCQKLAFPGHNIDFHFHPGGAQDTLPS